MDGLAFGAFGVAIAKEMEVYAAAPAGKAFIRAVLLAEGEFFAADSFPAVSGIQGVFGHVKARFVSLEAM